MKPNIELQDRYDVTMKPGLRAILEDIVKAIDQMYQMVTQIYVNIGYGQRPYQDGKVSASNTEASLDPLGASVARSVLTTASKAANEFNWMRSGGLRHYKVVLGPGDGVPTHHAIIDQDDANIWMQRLKASGGVLTNIASNVCRPYGMAGTKLQFGYYKANGAVLEFWPTELAFETYFYVEQDLERVNYP